MAEAGHSVKQAIDDAIARWGLKRSPVIVGVSGGPDSIALLLALRQAGCPVIAAHVNYRLRGEESDGDEAFVRQLAQALGCDLRVLYPPAFPMKHNRQAACRQLRYRWFEALAEASGVAYVATGHTANDQAETLLHRLIRGTGLKGLSGIARERSLSPNKPYPRLIRPWLTVSRDHILQYLTCCGQSYRRDSSNANPRYTRNRLRQDLLPRLAELNPRIVEMLGSLASQAAEVNAWLEVEAMRLLERVEKPRAGHRVVLDAAGLGEAPALLVREVFRAIWAREAWPTGAMTADHWRRLADIAQGVLTAADFPGSITARRLERVIHLRQRSPGLQQTPQLPP